jgi:hypothetical protein
VVLAAAVAFSTLVALAVVEVAARVAGHAPRRTAQRSERPMHEPDPVLGWKPKPGRHRQGPYVAGGSPVEVTIGPDGARKSAARPPAGRPELLLLGCSFTMGWAVADEDTWGWRLQELRPDVEVVNRGGAGYGTLQALLTLEQILGGDGPRPVRVLYGFLDHGRRNVAAPAWLEGLAFTGIAAGTPYVTLTPAGGLERHPPEAYVSLPLPEHLAAVALLERAWTSWRAGDRAAAAPQVTKLLIREMAERCRAAGVGFSLVFLNGTKGVEREYAAFAAQNHIDMIACGQHIGGQVVPGDAHPNAAVHRRWGECVAAALADTQRLPAR